MSDSRYGRLYTEADMIAVMTEFLDVIKPAWARGETPKARASFDEAMTRVAARETDSFTFPVDEPLFLLRGQDALAPLTVEHYWRACGHRSQVSQGVLDDPGVSVEHVAAVQLRVMGEWQKANLDRVKLPD